VAGQGGPKLVKLFPVEQKIKSGHLVEQKLGLNYFSITPNLNIQNDQHIKQCIQTM
jgi:hypothetical protein